MANPLAYGRSTLGISSLLLVALQLVGTTTSGAMLQGRVVAIADGDTLTVLDATLQQHGIRLQGIDAPESRQAFGKVSKYHLSSLAGGREVTVVYEKFDRYGRAVGKVLVGQSDMNLEQLRAGLAWVFTDYEAELSSTDRRAYRGAEQEARHLHRGLWADANPTPPWVFRRISHRGSSIAPSLPFVGASTAPVPAGAVIGNRRSHIFHRSDCPDYLRVAPNNRVLFATVAAAEQAGYRQARNCP